MRAPRCYEALLAFLLLMLGAIFSLLGLLFGALSLPVRNGDARSFLLGGLCWPLGRVCCCGPGGGSGAGTG